MVILLVAWVVSVVVVWSPVPLRLLVPSFDQEVACIKFVRTWFSFSSIASRLAFGSCSSGPFVPFGGTCRPGCLVIGEVTEGCRVYSLRCVAFGVRFDIKSVVVAAILADTLYYYIAECCDGGVDEMVGAIALVIISGLSHAGDEQYSSLPDSATYSKPATPRIIVSNSISKIGRQLNSLVHDVPIAVAKALGHPLLRVSLGGGVDREESVSWSTDPTPRTAAGHATCPTSERDSGEVPPRVGPMIVQRKAMEGVNPRNAGLALRQRGVASFSMRNSGWRPGFAHRERGVAAQHGLESWLVAWVFLGLPGCPRCRQPDSLSLFQSLFLKILA